MNKKAVPDGNMVTRCILDTMSEGAVVFDNNINIIFCNRKAEIFLKYHDIPSDIITMCRRIFDAIREERFKESFPGEIYMFEKLESLCGKRTYRLHVCGHPEPFVCAFIDEDNAFKDIDLNKIRLQFGLTRRELDVVRRVIIGLGNRAIADELDISEQTVKDYLSSVYAKLGVRNRLALMQFLISFRPLSGSDVVAP
jgi:DNA-binding CsgD family transcriptional regulator